MEEGETTLQTLRADLAYLENRLAKKSDDAIFLEPPTFELSLKLSRETGCVRPVWGEGASDGRHDVDVSLRGRSAEVWDVLPRNEARLAAVRPMRARGAGGLSRLALEGTGARRAPLLHLPLRPAGDGAAAPGGPGADCYIEEFSKFGCSMRCNVMRRVCWTGHPFVDAGLAAIAAVVGVKRLEDLKAEHLEKAAKELERILLSDQALGIGVERAFSGPKKTLCLLFPNSELDNTSNWKGGVESVKQKFRKALSQDLENAKICLVQSGDATLFGLWQAGPRKRNNFCPQRQNATACGYREFLPSLCLRRAGLWALRLCSALFANVGDADRCF
jgi:hypothetical protein